ncbi:MAG TPA: hypothetical protein VES19_10455 [Candidatus Limnocylindrales bacterium]|nr:hypothetical protein [Candidatus Limnocylindrales bacterium]
MPTIELREILTDADWQPAMALRLRPGQETHINLVHDILLESREDARRCPTRGPSTMPGTGASWAS